MFNGKTLLKALHIPFVPAEYREEYHRHRFYHNNLRILILAAVLCVEQLGYALFFSGSGSTLQEIYYYSAAAMLAMASAAGLFHRMRPLRPNTLHRAFEYSLGVVGMAVALLRVLLFEGTIFRIPTVYVAVLYGVAVIFFFHYRQSLFLYALLSFTAIVLIPEFHPQISASTYTADMVSNGFIAWLVSAMNYRNFVHDFLNKKKIEEKNRELREQSMRDALTSLFNRRRIDELLTDLYQKAERYDSSFTIILIDIDRFKDINDNYGHDVGDAVLKRLSSILSDNIRDVDICGRWGGEEFLVMCPQTKLPHAHKLAERLRGIIVQTDFGRDFRLTASFGVAEYGKGLTLKELLKNADVRLYKAKRAGRNRVVAGE